TGRAPNICLAWVVHGNRRHQALVTPGSSPARTGQCRPSYFHWRTTMRQLLGAVLIGATVLSGTALAGGTFPLTGKNTKIEFIGTKPNGKHDGGFEKVTGTASASGDAATLKLEV